MKKRIRILVAVLALILCVGSVASAAEAEIRFTWWGDAMRHETYNAICDEFEAQYPHIKVIREPSTWNDYWDKLATQVAGGNAPDVIGMHPNYASDYAGRGALLDLKPYMEKGTIRTERIADSVIEAGTINGLVCMLAQGVSTSAYYVNMDLVDKYGIDFDPTHEWTWAEFAEFGAQVREKSQAAGDDVYLITTPERDILALRYMVRQLQPGQDIFNENGDIVMTDESATAWFRYWQDLRDADIIPDAAETTEDNASPMEQKRFTLGKNMVMRTSANQYILYAQQMAPQQLAIMPTPIGNDGARSDIIECPFNSIYSGISDEQKEYAALFIDFFTNSEDSIKHLQMAQGAPTNLDMYDFLEDVMDEYNQKTMEFVKGIIEKGTPYVYAPVGANEINNVLSDISDQVGYGQLTPEEAGPEMVRQFQAIVDKNR